MIKGKLQQAVSEIKNCRDEVIDKLVQFAPTDSLLFWSNDDDLAQEQEKLWQPILVWANQELNTQYITTKSLNVPEQDQYSLKNLRKFISGLSDKELAAFYIASLNMKSELLAAALIKGKITALQAYEAANLEELWQARHWGIEEVSAQKRQELKQELCDIEQFLHE